MTDALRDLPELPPGLRWTRLSRPDLDRVEALHRLCVDGLAPRVVKPETHEFLHAMLAGRGQALGIEDSEGHLIAYGFLQHDLLPEDDPRAALGLPSSTPLAKLAGAAVAPVHRGAGLQRALINARTSLASPRHLLFSTASPYNPPSWASLLGEGFPVRLLEYRYGGHPRFIHVRPPGGTPPAVDGPARDVVFEDLASHERLLSEGWIGLSVAEAASCLRYRRLRAHA